MINSLSLNMKKKIVKSTKYLVNLLVKPLLSRNFCQKRVRVILTHAFSKNFVKLMFLIKKLRTGELISRNIFSVRVNLLDLHTVERQ